MPELATGVTAGRDGRLVSVVVPVRDGARYLRQSLDSIVAQTYPELEVIVMDDASTDESAAIAESYGPPVQVYRQPEPRGIYDNANDGISRARGSLVAVYHADDVYDADIVTREVSFLDDHPDVGAVFCLDVFVDPADREIGRLVLPPGVPSDEPLPYPTVLEGLLRHKNSFLRCQVAMVRASVYEQVGLYRQERFRNTSDLEMWLRISRSFPIGIVGRHLCRYRVGHGSSSGRYQHLRTSPENYFTILDLYLAGGGRHVVPPAALAAYEGHRHRDHLMIAVSQYILGSRAGSREALARVRAGALVGTPAVDRPGLLLLLAAMQVLVRLPRSQVTADLFYRRWHARHGLAGQDAIPR